MPPETIAGRYDVVREVGRGGMGAVWLCRDRTLGREVAVKQVGGLPGESTPHLARALREARSSAALNHPNVVSIFDAIEDGGHVWLVMEYLPSRTLSELVKAGPVDVRRAARLGAQVADGLAAAHARGVVHRDVKPGNILVTDADVAKISDFGIARTLGEEQLTQTGMVAGTPLYFSPALARGGQPTPADDVWALGASLYAAVEGEPPWPAQENSIAMLMHIVGHQPPVPRRAGALTEPIRRMMDVDADARPTMAEAAAALRAVAVGDDEASTAILAAPTATDPATGPVTGTASDATTAIPVPSPRRERTPTPTPAPVLAPTPPGGGGDEPRRRRTPVALLAAVAVLVLAIGAALLVGVLGDDDEEDAGTAGEEPSAQTSGAPSGPTGSGSTGETEETEETPSATPPEETTLEETADPTTDPTTEEPVSGSGDAGRTVEDYYALLPDDTRSAWEVLSPESQASVGSYGRYRAFWNTVDSVAVEGVEESEDGSVLVDLVYNGSDRETRRLFVEDGTITDGGVV